MTNRKLAYIIKHQSPVALPLEGSVGDGCRAMCESGAGSVLVVDRDRCLAGILTGRDIVRLLAEGADGDTPLSRAMTAHPISLPPTARALDAVRAMCEGGFRHVPVTEDGRVCGVVSRGDFKGMEFECYAWPTARTASRVSADRTLAEMIDGRTALTLAPRDTLQQACRLMCQHNAGSVLIADGGGRLQGIVTGRDAVRHLASGAATAATALVEIMTAAPQCLGPTSHAIDALRLMCDGGFRHVPVVENGRVLGVVSRNDFTGVEIDRLDEEEHLKECIW